MQHLRPETLDLLKKILPSVIAGSRTILGNDIFSYQVSYSSTDKNTSAWLLVFYGRVAFFSLTLPFK
jgi:hypothetical protein